ncbi:LINE-1 reverse transcriptase homolog [Eumeta japonica]|uniref:LINE-1 reverse transcriptase homolog n=1 Tax=Eumeta variegata TaxID=151549 RepID=A0A4C1Z3Y5_EUMVA|nr:LINE-1 reverse transcriptase homolog [Eumeta japonica]
MKNELKALYKLISKLINLDYKAYCTKIIKKHLNTTNSVKKAYKELRTHKSWIEELKDKTKNTQNRTEIMKLATNFYKKLYSVPNQYTYELPDINRIEARAIIDESEVIKGIKSLKAEKSPGPDGITNEVIKTGCEHLAKPLTLLFNQILNSSHTPRQWSESDIILLYKKGDPNNISNYRPISLLPSLYKLFSSIIEKKIKKSTEKYQPVEQAGFRRGFSTVDHIHSLEMLIEKYQEFKRPLYIVFIDYQKAFDSLFHSSIWETLLSQGVPLDYIKVIKNIYDNSTSRVKLETTEPPIQISKGVRQGDPLSPTIFIAVLETIIGKLNWEKVGININGRYLSHLRFADDIVLLSESTNQLQEMINTLHEESRKVGLEINLTKTNIMTNHTEKPIYLENSSLTYANAYIYLSKQISFNQQNNELEVERRVNITWKKFWSLKEILKSDMTIRMKAKVMYTCLLPSLTYACQTWKFTRTVKNKITSCQRSMERCILKIKKIQKIRHTDIRQKTKVIDALSHSQKLKWR